MVDIDEVIQVIRSSDDAEAAKTKLIAVFDLDEIQAQYILDLRLRRLTKMSRIELEAERDDLKRRIEELERILASDEALDGVVIDEMDDAVAKYGTPRRTVLLDEDEEGNLTPVVAHGDDGVSANAMRLPRAPPRPYPPQQPMSPQPRRPRRRPAMRMPPRAALQIDDEPCAVMLSATGLIARTSEDAVERWENRSASDGRRQG